MKSWIGRAEIKAGFDYVARFCSRNIISFKNWQFFFVTVVGVLKKRSVNKNAFVGLFSFSYDEKSAHYYQKRGDNEYAYFNLR